MESETLGDIPPVRLGPNAGGIPPVRLGSRYYHEGEAHNAHAGVFLAFLLRQAAGGCTGIL
jgi:hypothetical protein